MPSEGLGPVSGALDFRAASQTILQHLHAGLLHIATHGVYRQDNPMFSGIRLGDGYLNLFDLYQMRLNASLGSEQYHELNSFIACP